MLYHIVQILRHLFLEFNMDVNFEWLFSPSAISVTALIIMLLTVVILLPHYLKFGNWVLRIVNGEERPDEEG